MNVCTSCVLCGHLHIPCPTLPLAGDPQLHFLEVMAVELAGRGEERDVEHRRLQGQRRCRLGFAMLKKCHVCFCVENVMNFVQFK